MPDDFRSRHYPLNFALDTIRNLLFYRLQARAPNEKSYFRAVRAEI